MQPTLCSRCKKNVAVVFISKMEGDKTTNEGLCLKCAKELGLPQVDDMMKRMGISDEDLDTLNNEMLQAMSGVENIEDLPGGEDAVFAAECAMLQAHGHRVITYERNNDAGGLAQKLLLPLRAIYSTKTVREVRALIRKEQVDLVHVHNTLLTISPSVFQACFKEHVPAVQTLHNFRIFCPNGILMRDGHVCEECPQHGLGCAVRHSCYRGSRAQSLVCAGIYAFHRLLGTYRKVNLITLTEFDRSKLLEFNRKASRPVFTPERLYCKPNGVAAPNHSPLPWAQRKNQIVFAGRLEELKGLRTAIEAWQLLGPDAPQLIVDGTGPLEAWAKENAPDTVTFTGQLPHGTLTELLAQSRAALCPSLCYESFALIPAEAHAVGTPVLASDLGNVGAAVQEGIDGLHFAPGNAAALADAVRKLQNVGETFDLTAMQQKACQAYNAEQNYRGLMTIYREIMRNENS